jgi:hypothetical protein
VASARRFWISCRRPTSAAANLAARHRVLIVWIQIVELGRRGALNHIEYALGPDVRCEGCTHARRTSCDASAMQRGCRRSKSKSSRERLTVYGKHSKARIRGEGSGSNNPHAAYEEIRKTSDHCVARTSRKPLLGGHFFRAPTPGIDPLGTCPKKAREECERGRQKNG